MDNNSTNNWMSNLINDDMTKNLMYLGVFCLIVYLLYICFCKTETEEESTESMKGGSKNKPCITLYYVDWCPHCQDIKPEWDKLEKSKDINKLCDVKRVNCEENDAIVEEKAIEGYPTIIYTDVNNNEELYNEDRTYISFKEFILDKQ